MSAIDAVEAGQIVYWNGGVEAYQLSDLEDLYYLSKDKKSQITNKRMFAPFHCYQNYVDAAEESEDPEMKRLLRIIGDHPDVPKLLTVLRRNSTDDQGKADITVSTVHRAKGLSGMWCCLKISRHFRP